MVNENTNTKAVDPIYNNYIHDLANKADRVNLDGNWIRLENGGIVIATGLSLTTKPQEFDLTEILPKDSYSYEVLLDGNYKGSGVAIYIYGETPDMTLCSKPVVSRGYPNDAQTNYSGTTIINGNRKVYMRGYSTNVSIASLGIKSYRRLGVK